MSDLLEVRGLHKRYGGFTALEDVSFRLARGGMTAVVGESGSGKSTLARLILRLEEADAGEILLEGRDLRALKGKALRRVRKDMQMIFQDPHASLNPRMNVQAILEEPLRAHGVPRAERLRRVREMMDRARIPADFCKRHAHELSGGQRQRIGIARALLLEPRLVIADEPTAALDVSIQARLLDLLREMRDDLDFTLLFISHDLAVVHSLCAHILVMQNGRIVESGTRDDIFRTPRDPYTRALLDAAPRGVSPTD